MEKLLSPVQPLANFNAASQARKELPGDLLTGKWTLLYWSEVGCGLPCEAGLFKIRQVRLSLSKDISRVQTVYLAAGLTDDVPIDRHPKLVVAYFPDKRNNVFAEQINAYPRNSIYIVDPLGNLMMRYSDNATSKGILKDLKKLLRASKIG